MPSKNSFSVDDPYAAESDSRAFLGYAGLILLLVGALLFFTTFVADSDGLNLVPGITSGSSANAGANDPPEGVTTTTTAAASGW